MTDLAPVLGLRNKFIVGKYREAFYRNCCFCFKLRRKNSRPIDEARVELFFYRIGQCNDTTSIRHIKFKLEIFGAGCRIDIPSLLPVVDTLKRCHKFDVLTVHQNSPYTASPYPISPRHPIFIIKAETDVRCEAQFELGTAEIRPGALPPSMVLNILEASMNAIPIRIDRYAQIQPW